MAAENWRIPYSVMLSNQALKKKGAVATYFFLGAWRCIEEDRH